MLGQPFFVFLQKVNARRISALYKIMVLKEIIDIIEEGLKMPLGYLWNPEKRIYLGYILSSLLMAYYVYKKANIKKSFLGYLIPKKIWTGASATTDYTLLFFNAFVKIILISPLLILSLYLAFYVNEFLMRQFGIHTFNISPFILLLIYTITLTLVSDFSSYILHYAQHKIPLLWEFHKVHHSATELNPLTQYRIHPLELIANNVRALLVVGLVAGVFDYFSAGHINKLTFFGVNIFSFLFLTFGANLRHSHIRFTYFNIVEYIFISPFQHQIHHSTNPKHYDKNMGAKLAIWDWMFGTLVRSSEVDTINFGLGKEEDTAYNSFWKNMYKPFVNTYKRIIGIFQPTR